MFCRWTCCFERLCDDFPRGDAAAAYLCRCLRIVPGLRLLSFHHCMRCPDGRMRKNSRAPILRLRYLAYVLVLCAEFLGVPAACGAEGQGVAAVTALRGMATINHPGSDRPEKLTCGDLVQIGDVLRTEGASGAQISFADGSFMNIANNSSLRINQYSFDQQTNRMRSVIRILSGRVRLVVFQVRSPESFVRVETGTASIFVDELADFVIDASLKRTVVAVLDHVIRVRNAQPFVVGEVQPGSNQKTVIDAKLPPGPPQTITPAERSEYLQGLIKM